MEEATLEMCGHYISTIDVSCLHLGVLKWCSHFTEGDFRHYRCALRGKVLTGKGLRKNLEMGLGLSIGLFRKGLRRHCR